MRLDQVTIEFDEVVVDAPAVKSLVWQGETLVDWASGGRRIHLDGTVEESGTYFAYKFDAAIASPSGDFVVVYERLGTKAILLKNGKLHRELDRSYYHAGAYEFPVALFQLPSGEDALVHCPREYCRIDIEEADSGRCLTDGFERNPSDIFHSRLSTSPGDEFLASAGWVWHPCDVLCLWSVAEVLRDPTCLDRSGIDVALENEVRAVVFLDGERLLVSTGEDGVDGVERLVIVRARDGSVLSSVAPETKPGALFALGTDKAIGCFGHPRVFDLATGAALYEWPHLRAGERASSIIHHLDLQPPIAFTSSPPMIAVAHPGGVTVIRFRT